MGKTVEQIYQKKSQHEHILTRPDMYIGTIESLTDEIWVYDEADGIMKQRKCTWIPGLYKIFDEILVNAADNKVRDPVGQTLVKVWIDEHRVRVYNNGEGIPIQKHREHDLWIPEMIFGHLLTSSNYDDNEAKVTGGRNGFGAKLTNVFSKRFEVETVHSRSRKKFYMRWTDNMLHHEEPLITSCDSPDYTMVTFYPDFKRFQIDKFSEDMILLMRRRVYDMAGCTPKSLKCFLNDDRIAISTFPEYIALYPTMGEDIDKRSYARVNDRWELSVRVSNIGFQQVSFVNSIATSRGGSHVKYILDQIITKVTEQAKKRNKTEVKPHMIRPHIFLFLNCLIENPGFDSQTKETLNTVKSRFGSTCDIPSSMIDYILHSGIVERSVEMANSKLTREMASKMRSSDRKQILGIPKLDDANEAGGKHGYRCTLILTEGDSAKTLCTAGLAVKDRDYFGVFPLRGKPLNVRDASLKKVIQCEEIQSVMKIMGLDIRQKDVDVNALRYGHLMIMADQDHDGSHIKGLIINMIHYYWPTLLRAPGFMQQFITPIVKARRKSRGAGDERAISFFSMRDYFEWKQNIGEAIANYEIRYYKGLGTSGAKEGREYFENIERHRLDFVEESPADSDRICMAFAKNRADERKEWITRYKANENNTEAIDYSIPRMTYGEFVDRELILFSIADCERSIPSMVDGFKPGQRKILFSCFKRNLTRSIKVVQLAGYVSEHSAYHHGEQSLVQTIVGMAQDFVGSNNVPLLCQDGQFGTRLQGGKDHAAGRYIFTKLMQLARYVFHSADDYVVQYRDDDGLSVEPFHYIPVIPMVLVNGTSGIGTGFSTNIPSYNPIDIIDNIKRIIHGESLEPMQPWYFAFTGTIQEKEKGKFTSHGRYEIRPDGVICIMELPVGVWTQAYKKFLEELREKEILVQYREHNTDVSVDFELFIHPEVLHLWREQDVVEERLQLREYIHATNIIAFNYEGRLTKYHDAESILLEFYPIRLEYYAKRKDYILGGLRRMTSKLENMVRFVREVVAGQLVLANRKKKDLLDELRRRQYTPFPYCRKKNVTSTTIEQEDDDAANEQQNADEDLQFLEHTHNVAPTSGAVAPAIGATGSVEAEPLELLRASRDYDYLLGMKLWNLTFEMIERLEAQLRRANEETQAMEKRTPKDLWLEDLEALRPRLLAYFLDREREIASIQRKKLEKKKPFDVRRLRVPILSDSVRQDLQKEANKLSNARRVGQPDGATDPNGTTKGKAEVGRSLPSKRTTQKRRRKKKDSDEDDDDLSLFSSDMDSDDGDGTDGKNILGVGDNEETLAAMREKAKKSLQKHRSADERNDRISIAKRKPRKEVGEAAGKSAGKTNTIKATTDDFSLDGFGLEAMPGYAAPLPTSSALTYKPTPAPTNLHSKMDEDEDDLALLGLAPVNSGKTKTPAAPSLALKVSDIKSTASQAPRGNKTKLRATSSIVEDNSKKSTNARRKRRRGESDEESFSSSSESSFEEDSDVSGGSSSTTDYSDEDFND